MEINHGMHTGRIIKTLQEVYREFTTSIDNPEIRTLIYNNTIIAGGSIASMLMGERVRDYDFYFTDPEIAVKVLNYFIERDFSATRNLAHIRKMENIKGVEEDRPYVKLVLGSIEAKHEGPFRGRLLTSNALSLSGKKGGPSIQLIVRFAGSADKILSNFDFVHCTCYYDSVTNKLCLNQPALESMLSRRLLYIGSLYPIATIFRLKKFIKRGWNISAGQITKLALQITECKLTPLLLVDQLMGIDLHVMRHFIEKINDKIEVGPDGKEERLEVFLAKHFANTSVATMLDDLFESGELEGADDPDIDNFD